jgi:hypothetical protein
MNFTAKHIEGKLYMISFADSFRLLTANSTADAINKFFSHRR